MKISIETKSKLEALAVTVPFPYSVVEDVFKKVDDIEKAKVILDHSSQMGISVYTILSVLNHKYRGYTIEFDTRVRQLMFYPTYQGINHDYNFNGERYVYCGNCGWADDLEEAKMLIDEKLERL